MASSSASPPAKQAHMLRTVEDGAVLMVEL